MLDVWSNKFRPNTIDDCILPARIKNIFKKYVELSSFQHLLLWGEPGVGKTSVSLALCNEIDITNLFINASTHGNIDTLRNDMTQFATTMSLNGNIKCILLDEADNVSMAMQSGLRGFIETHEDNTRFILTANYPNKIIDAIRSRCVEIDFTLTNEEKNILLKEYRNRIYGILKEYKIEYNKEDLFDIIIKFFPDFRKILNTIQKESIGGKLELSKIIYSSDDVIDSFISHIKNRNFKEIRKWVSENNDIDFYYLIAKLYEKMFGLIENDTIPILIEILSESEYQRSFKNNIDIHIVWLAMQLLKGIRFK